MIKKILLLIVLTCYSQMTYANNFVDKTIDGFRFKYIKYDTESKDYIFKIGVNPDYHATNLLDLMEANNGISAINGVFFCPASYSECGGKDFTKNERYVKGEKIGQSSSTEHRVVFAIDENNKPFLFQTDKINSLDENNIYYGFSNFPLLLENKVNKFQDYVDLGLVDSKMKTKLKRNFVCSDETNRYIFSGYVSEIELEKLPTLLIKLGCNNALNLDAGYSSAMIYNSRYIIGPGRNILDGIIIERKDVDTKLIIDKAKNIVNLIEKKLRKNSYNERIVFLDKFFITLPKIRNSIYEKHSFDIYSQEAGKIIGYEIDVKNKADLEKVYLVNYLEMLLGKLKVSYESENVNNINKENLLF